jgi:molybdate transport system substrate-binding protein
VTSRSGPISLFSALAVQAALDSEILPAYRNATGAEVHVTWDPTTVLIERIAAGAQPDVIVAVSGSVAELASRGAVVPTSIVPIAKVGIGLATASARGVPQIDTVEALVGTLLNARSVAYSRTGASGIYFAGLLEQLGITEQVNRRATVIEKGYTAEAVVDGRADLAVQQLSELRFVAAVHVVGPLPEPVQKYTQFSAALGVAAAEDSSATDLIGLFRDEHALAAYMRAGLQAP